MAARPEPMAKVREMVVLTLIPIRPAAALSSETARIAVPIFVLLVKSVRQIMIRMQARIVTIVTPETISCPSKSFKVQLPVTEEKVFGLEPQISRAAFCRK